MMDQLSLVPYEGGSDGGKYKECMRNHAAAMGGQAFDGCGEFMPSSPDALTCAACGCHRSFHRRASAGGGSSAPLFFRPPPPPPALSTAPPPHHQHHHHHVAALQAFLPPPTPAPPHLALPYHAVPSAPWSSVRPGSETPPRPEDHHHLMGFGFGSGGVGSGGSGSSGRKRFRTKFTPEQKERMREFAEKQGWRINRNDDGALERFCHEIGVRRQVLKVWMHNHKNHHNGSQQKNDHHHHLAAASVPNRSAADVGAAMTGISINPAAGTGTGAGVGIGIGVGAGGHGDDDDDDDDDDDTDDSPPRAAVSSPSPSPISV